MILLARDRGWHISEDAVRVQVATPAPTTAAAQPDKARERNLAWFARWRRRTPAPVGGE
jgi:hypothetical protein